jgi:cytochrome c-type biogenesis protein CcmE
MSRIDEELEQAVRDAETSSDPEANDAQSGAAQAKPTDKRDVARPVVSDTEEPKRSWGLLAGLGALMAGILALVFSSGDDAVVYSYQVDELKAKAAELGERQVRVQGMLVSGTLTRRDQPCEYRFFMQKAGAESGEPLKVQYAQCVVPDTFRDVKGVEVEVTAEGRLAEDGHLEASTIFAKCPSKYEMKEAATAMGGDRPQHGGGQPKPEFIPPQVEGVR